MADVVLITGAFVIVAGVALLSVPASMIVAGMGLMLVGLALASRASRTKQATAPKRGPEGD